MSQRLKELREKQEKLVADARAKMDEINADTPAERAKEIEGEYDRIMAEYDRLDERARKEEDLEAREQALRNAIERPDNRRPNGDTRNVPGDGRINGGAGNETDRVERAREAFNLYLRHGVEGVPQEMRSFLQRWQDPENRAQSQVSVTGGAYLVPDTFMPELVKAMKAWGPMIDPGITRQLNTSTGATLSFPTFDDTSNEGQLIAENTQVQLAEVQFGLRGLGAYKYTSGVVLVPSELLQDSTLNIEQIIRDAMAERIGRIGNRHMTLADGAAKPVGLIPAIGTKQAASQTAISLDDFIELMHDIDPAYRGDPSCRWMLHDQILKAVRKLKDQENNYIWQPANAQTGQPARIFEYPYSVNQVMDSTIAQGKKTLVFGAMNRYVVRIVNQFAIRRLVERYADFDQTGFIGFARMDGNVMDPNAFRALVHP